MDFRLAYQETHDQILHSYDLYGMSPTQPLISIIQLGEDKLQTTTCKRPWFSMTNFSNGVQFP